MLDINLFREEKGNNPEIIRESQRRRFANVELVDEVIKLDKEWRQRNPPSFILYYFISLSFSSFFSYPFSFGIGIGICLGQFELENLRKEFNKINKQIAQLRIVIHLSIFLLSCCRRLF